MGLRITIVVGVALALLACGEHGHSLEMDRAETMRAERDARVAAGREIFAAFCATCHGTGATGNGPAAAGLRTPPADLTQIAARRGATFRGGDIAAYIDGRTSVIAHGTREMPVWGRRFDDRNAAILTDETRLSPGMIFNVVEYLESIQR